MDVQRAGRLSRRQLIAGAAAMGAAALAGTEPARGDTPPPDDPTLLTKALALERLTVVAYEHLIPLAAFTAHERRVLRRLARQDRAHVRALEAALTTRGDALAPEPPGPGPVAR